MRRERERAPLFICFLMYSSEFGFTIYFWLLSKAMRTEHIAQYTYTSSRYSFTISMQQTAMGITCVKFIASKSSAIIPAFNHICTRSNARLLIKYFAQFCIGFYGCSFICLPIERNDAMIKYMFVQILLAW